MFAQGRGNGVIHVKPIVKFARAPFVQILMAMFVTSAVADEPLDAPQGYTVCSPSGVFCADLDPQKAITRVYRRGQDADDLWVMDGWFRQAALADDGKTLVIGYDGLNLLPLDYHEDDSILWIYYRGRLIRAVALSEVIEDFSSLQRTVSHYLWGHYVGFDEEGRYVIETVEGRSIAIDVTTGEVVKRR